MEGRSRADPAHRDHRRPRGARGALRRRSAAPFELDDYTRWRLLEGLDDIGLTLRHEADIDAYEGARPAWLPTTLPARTATAV